jgi:trehalose 6-phosphate phosphatase
VKILRNAIDIGNFFERVRTTSLLMLDYDGTLAPLVKERMQAFPYPGVKDRLFALLSLKKARTAIISGRRLSDLEELLDFHRGLELWGSHGLERKLPDGRMICAKINAKIQKGLEDGKRACLEHVDLEHCEIKPYGIALHWRGMNEVQKSQTAVAIQPLWEQIAAVYGLELHHFDDGLELRCKEKNKGDAVHELLSEMPNDAAVAYLGDDLTDEEAFERLGDRGLKILVREQYRPTLADIHLIPPKELLTFLDLWILINKEGQHG